MFFRFFFMFYVVSKKRSKTIHGETDRSYWSDTCIRYWVVGWVATGRVENLFLCWVVLLDEVLRGYSGFNDAHVFNVDRKSSQIIVRKQNFYWHWAALEFVLKYNLVGSRRVWISSFSQVLLVWTFPRRRSDSYSTLRLMLWIGNFIWYHGRKCKTVQLRKDLCCVCWFMLLHIYMKCPALWS